MASLFYTRLIRWLHDSYAWICYIFKIPLQAITSKAVFPYAEKVIPIQTEGRSQISHPLEEALYSQGKMDHLVKWPNVSMLELRDVFLTGDHAQVFLQDDRVLQICPSMASQKGRRTRRPLKFLAKKIEAPLFHLTGKNHENHGHFLVDHLPRLFACRPHLRPNIKILLAEKHARWKLRYLRLLGFSDDDIVTTSSGTLAAPHLFYAPMLRGNTPLGDPSILQTMFKEMRERLAAQNSSPSEKSSPYKAIWISRKNAPDRRLENEDELVKETEQILQGPVLSLELVGLSLAQQIQTLNQAEWIIGAQGQGLINTAFVTGKRVVILDTGTSNAPYTWSTAFADIAALSSNQALRLFAESGDLKKQNWSYPIERFRKEMMSSLKYERL